MLTRGGYWLCNLPCANRRRWTHEKYFCMLTLLTHEVRADTSSGDQVVGSSRLMKERFI